MGEERSYLVKDLAGCRVLTVDGEELGVLRDVLPTRGNDIWVVGEGPKEILIPALKSVIQRVDLGARRIDVVLPPGLRGGAGG